MSATTSTASSDAAGQAVRGRAVQISKPNAAFELVDVTYAVPGHEEVRIKIEACGVCHSDSFPVQGHFPGLQYPAVPGHEIVGKVDAVGSGVTRLKVGDRVGVGWHGGHCHECLACRQGDFICCDKLDTPGITIAGGYAQYGNYREEVCALVPDGLSSVHAAPLLCAGVTTFNALRHSGAIAGDTVAVLGLGGLGHLGVQFANKMGFRTVGIARGADKAAFARELGAHEYIDSQEADAVQKLIKMGGARVILATATSARAMAPFIDSLGLNGHLMIVGASMEPLEVNTIALLGKRRSISGWPSGVASDSEDCMRFAALHGIKPMTEVFALADAAQAYERMMSGQARFRAVLEIK
jgi:D-arabinose 1-dehydrogenase-like Zn-dependent alcohol dehydrogenase